MEGRRPDVIWQTIAQFTWTKENHEHFCRDSQHSGRNSNTEHKAVLTTRQLGFKICVDALLIVNAVPLCSNMAFRRQ